MPCYHPITIKRWFDVKKFEFKTVPVPFMTWERLKQVNELPANRADGVFYSHAPCGRCVGCLLDKALAWTTRNFLEQQMHDHSFFVTCTYDDENVPLKECLSHDLETFGVQQVLKKKDHQDFMKRLRKNGQNEFGSEWRVRYFVCGEYGEHTQRPHLHYLLYGSDLHDLRRPTKAEMKGKIAPAGVYFSDFLSSCWKKGSVSVSKACPERIAYASQYTLKKVLCQERKMYIEQLLGVEYVALLNFTDQKTGEVKAATPDLMKPFEFIGFSNNPGLGSLYYDQNKDYIQNQQSVAILSGGNVLHRPLPETIRRKVENDCGEDFLLQKKEENRQRMLERVELRLAGTDMPLEQVLRNDEAAVLERIRRKVRDVE